MIEVGEYIRTKHGKIGKVIGITNVTGQKRLKYLIEWKKGEAYYITDVTIKKHNKYLKKLIETGDIVHTKDVLNEDYYYMYDKDMVKATIETIKEGIKLVSIVTKEQFKSIEYEV